MADLAGEQYIPTSAEEIRDQILSDMRLGALSEGLPDPPIGRGTDSYNVATSVANVSLIGLQNQKIQNDNMSVFDARGEPLDRLLRAESLPEAPKRGSSGKVRPTLDAAATINAGQALVTGRGVRLEVTTTVTGIVDGAEIDVVSLDKGAHTNADGGDQVRFISPPLNVQTNAIISHSRPLTGGADDETAERKRLRILNKRRSGPAGSWGHAREVVLDADPSISNCYVYPALGGPASVKVVPVRSMDRKRGEFTRQCSDGQILNAREALFEVYPDGVEVLVQAAVDAGAEFGIEITIPGATSSGGTKGPGWKDAAPWPRLEVLDAGRVRIASSANNGSQITVTAQTAVPPSAWNTNISWWSSVDRRFLTSLITAVSGASAAWVLTLQKPFRTKAGDEPTTGEFISPAADNIDKYGEAWLDIFERFGPEENTEVEEILERAFRHPRISSAEPAEWTDSLLAPMIQAFPEISKARSLYGPTSPGVADVDDGPNVFVPANFGVYPP